MIRLLLADLRALGNLLRHASGRRLAIATAISLGFLVVVSMLFGSMLAEQPELRAMATEFDQDRVRALTGTLLLPALLLTLWFGFGGGSRQLFELPQLPMLLTAPLDATRILLATWLRFSAIVTLWATALSAPAIHTMTAALGAHAAIRIPVPAIALAAACLVLPTLALVLAAQIVLLRWLSGRWTRFALGTLGAVGSVVFSVLLIAGALAQRDAALSVLWMIRGRAVLPWLIDAPARMLAGFAVDAPSVESILAAAIAPLGAAAGLAALSAVYRDAWANAQQAVEPLLRSRRRGRWPSGTAAVVFRKELAQLTHRPGQLLGVLFSTLVVVVLGASRFVGEHIAADPRVPEPARHVFLMLALWLFAQLTVAPGCVVRLTVLDGPQWSLWVASPARPGAILRGKLRVIGLLQAWPALVAAILGGVQLGATPAAVAVFLAVVPAGVVWTTALTACVGTIPPLMRPSAERSNLPVLVAVVLLLFALQLTVLPGVQAWTMLVERGAGQGPLLEWSDVELIGLAVAAAWVLALLGAIPMLWLATRQFARLASPER